MSSPAITCSLASSVAIRMASLVSSVSATSLTESTPPAESVALALRIRGLASVLGSSSGLTFTVTLTSPPPPSAELPAGTVTAGHVMVRPDCVPLWLMFLVVSVTSLGKSNVRLPVTLEDVSL